jgi:hypothetical protein
VLFDPASSPIARHNIFLGALVLYFISLSSIAIAANVAAQPSKNTSDSALAISMPPDRSDYAPFIRALKTALNGSALLSQPSLADVSVAYFAACNSEAVHRTLDYSECDNELELLKNAREYYSEHLIDNEEALDLSEYLLAYHLGMRLERYADAKPLLLSLYAHARSGERFAIPENRPFLLWANKQTPYGGGANISRTEALKSFL